MTELKQEIEFEKEFLKQFKDFKCKNCCDSGDGDFHDRELIKEALKRYKEQRIKEVIGKAYKQCYIEKQHHTCSILRELKKEVGIE